VNGKTGMVTITDSRFQLVALPSTTTKPVRLAVQDKTTLDLIASVFFVANLQTAISLDAVEVNYLEDFQTMSGVHVKDLDVDIYRTESVDEDADYNAGNIYLTTVAGGGGGAGEAISSNRFGIVDRLGNIFLKPEFTLRLKGPVVSNDPVVFEILNEDGLPIYEVYIGADFEKVEVIRERQEFMDFNLLAALLEYGVIKKAYAAVTIPDRDQDGLNDLEEILLSLDPLNSDTDSDSYKDGEELVQNYDPARADEVLFSDIDTSSEGFEKIINIFRRGIIEAYDDGTIRPDELLSREEFVKMNLGAVCIQCTRFHENIKKDIDEDYLPSPFPDTDISDEYLYCVKEGKNREIVSGYKGTPNKGFFLPLNYISRAEATKVMLETGRQESYQGLNLSDSNVGGKPWYYNYVLSAQEAKLYPTGNFYELDQLAPAEFQTWFDQQLQTPGSRFIEWISGSITKREFAIMVSNFTEMFDCMNEDQDGEGLPDNYEKYIYNTSVTNPDTDDGGVIDLIEVINKTNPLDPSDDLALLEQIKDEFRRIQPWYRPE